MKSQAPAIGKLIFLGIVTLLPLAGCGGGTASIRSGSNSGPTVSNPGPAITTISPPSIVAGSAAFTLTVTGTNFVSSSMIDFGGNTVFTNFVSSTTLTATISATAIATVGTATVAVSNPAPGGGASNAMSFVILGLPTITYLYPSCTPAGGTAFTLSVSGSGLAPGSVLRWSGSERPTSVLAGTLTAQILASDIAAPGTAAVTIFNPAVGVSSNSLTFTVTAGGVSPQSIALDPSGKFAYVADEGCSGLSSGGVSTAPGTVSMYTINATTGTLTSIGAAVSGGYGGHAVAVDPSGRFAYMANDGEGDTAGSVSIYSIDVTTGALMPTGTIQAPCVPSPGSCSPWSLAVQPSGKFAYVANEGGFSPTSVSIYAIDATTGGLTRVGLATADGRAVAVVVDPSGKFAYVADGENSDGSKGLVSMYTIDSATGILTSVGTVAAGVSPFSIAIHPTGKFVYVVNHDSNDISMYTLNTTTGNLTSIGTLAAVAGSITIHPSGKFAYVATTLGVSMYTIDVTTGVLTFAGTTGSGSSPGSIAIHPSGNFAYGTNSSSNSVSMYSIDIATGALMLIGTIGT